MRLTAQSLKHPNRFVSVSGLLKDLVAEQDDRVARDKQVVWSQFVPIRLGFQPCDIFRNGRTRDLIRERFIDVFQPGYRLEFKALDQF